MSDALGSFSLLVDAGFAAHGPPSGTEGGEFLSLMQDDGEYVSAIERLFLTSAGSAWQNIPDEVILHLYSYEILERMRDTMSAADPAREKVLVLPFWPVCMFQAAGIEESAAREMEEMFVTVSSTCYARRPRSVIEAEARRVLGALRFDPRDYVESVESLASLADWIVIDATPGDEG